MKTRIEVDPLGERAIPENAYYGIQTLRATENFPVSGIKPPLPFIKAYVLVKKAAALANAEVGWLDEAKSRNFAGSVDPMASRSMCSGKPRSIARENDIDA